MPTGRGSWKIPVLALSVALAAVALGAAPALAQEDKSFRLLRADVAVRVERDGSLRVAETLTFSYSGSFQGAFRDIPLRPGERIDDVSVTEAGRSYRPGASAEIGSSGAPDTFGVARTAEGLRVVWHYRATDETRTFTVGYRFSGLAVAYDDVVDVNLQVWGDEWEVQLDELSASLALPDRATGREYRVFGHPAWVRGVVDRRPAGAELRATSVPPRQFVELRVLFPRELLASTDGAKVRNEPGLDRILAEERADAAAFEEDVAQIQAWRDDLGRYLLLLLALAIAPALLVLAGTWLFFGRERSVAYDREYEQDPPSDLPPALVSPLLRQSTVVGSHEFTATLFDLIRRGRYEARPVTTERSTWAGLRKQQVADLELSIGAADLHEPFERDVAKVVDDVLDGGSERLSRFRDRISEKRTTQAGRFTSFQKHVAEWIDLAGWYDSTGRRVVIGAALLFALAATALLWIGFANLRPGFPRPSDIVLIALGSCAAVNTLVLIVLLAWRVNAAGRRVPLMGERVWRRRTPQTQLEARRWEAFRGYLTDFPRLDVAPPATLEIWERYLVYGIALGIAERVLQGAQLLMPRELAEASSVYWISGSSDLGSGATSLGIGDLSSGFGSALTP
ncbi:MAG TPA: DUF2207 domain-containing protein, partial [Actinomycetota bacterium]|nr:DUF2207 domain-containing protein [Actinomycetota bacterium]